MIVTIASVMLIFGGIGALVVAALFPIDALVWRRRARRLQAQLDHANGRVTLVTLDRDFWREEAYRLHCRNIEAMRRAIAAAKSSEVN